jgi:transcription termination/antitermination protein NusA
VLEVRRSSRGPEIIVSRSHPLMLRRLLELEVPEIRAGQVEINAVAREAGTRAKIAVSARQDGIDPVGACVGMRGIRIQTISRELHGERIDVIEWHEDSEAFISNALSVPNIVCVTLDENNPGGRTASVVVLDDQLSLTIGRSGQNARLAAKLTNWRIDIQGATEAAMWALSQVNKNPDLLDALKGKAVLIPRLAAIMRSHEENRYPYTDEERGVIGDIVKAVREALIARRQAERPGSSQARARQRAQDRAEAERAKAKQTAQARVPRGAYKVPISDLELSEKAKSHLLTNGLQNVGEIMERMAVGDEALLMLDGVGVKGLREIKAAVEASGLHLLSEGATETPADAADEAPEEAPKTDEAIEEAKVERAEEIIEEAEWVVEEAAVLEETEETALPEEPLVAETVAADATPTAEDAEMTIDEDESDALEDRPDTQGDREKEDLNTAFSMDSDEPELPGFLESLDEVVYEDEDEEEDFGDRRSSSRKRKGKRRRRTVVYDDSTGETFVVRRHRRNSSWDDFGEDY